MTDLRSGADHPGQPWIELGYCGGGFVKGKQFTSYDCYCQATLLDPNCPTAWCEIGCEGGFHRGGPQRCFGRSVECFERSIQCELDARHGHGHRAGRCMCTCGGKAWACLAALGGGKLRTDGLYAWHVEVEPASCIVNALECGWFGAVDKYVFGYEECESREGRSMWCLLGCEGGGFFRGRFYSASMCYAEAVKEDPTDALAWLYLGRERGGSMFLDGGRWACYQKARHYSRDFNMICARAGCRNPLKCSLH